MKTTDQIKIAEFMRLMGDDVENWLRWGRKRDYLPPSHSCVIGKLYKAKNKDFDSAPEQMKTRVRELDAVRMERIVTRLPETHRHAFVLYMIGRGSVNGKIRTARGRDDGAKALRVGLSMYHRRVREACAIVQRQWLVGKTVSHREANVKYTHSGDSTVRLEHLRIN